MPSECMLSELNLFKPNPTILSVDRVEKIILKPLASLENAKFIEFVSFGFGNGYRNMNNVYLQLKVRLMKNATEPHLDTSTTTLAPNTLYSLFSSVNCYYNNRNISTQDHELAQHENYILNILNFDEMTASQHLANVPFLPDTPGGFDNHLPLATGATKVDNKNFDERVKMFTGSKEVEIYGRLNLHTGAKFLLNEVDARITLQLANSSTYIIAATAEDTSVLRIIDATLYIDNYILNTDLLMAHERLLQTRPAIYPRVKTDIKAYTISAQVSSFSVPNLTMGIIPRRLIIATVQTSSLIGNITENCYSYDHFDIKQISVSINGEMIEPPLQFDFKNSSNPMSGRGYANLLHCLNYGTSGQCHSISKAHYDNKTFINGFKLLPDLDSSCDTLSRQVDLLYRTPLKNSITLLCLLEYDSSIMIDSYRNVYVKN